MGLKERLALRALSGLPGIGKYFPIVWICLPKGLSWALISSYFQERDKRQAQARAYIQLIP